MDPVVVAVFLVVYLGMVLGRLPGLAIDRTGVALLAIASTLAGNLLLFGSIANLIVVEGAARLGLHIGWRQHARIGMPVTLGTLAIAAC